MVILPKYLSKAKLVVGVPQMFSRVDNLTSNSLKSFLLNLRTDLISKTLNHKKSLYFRHLILKTRILFSCLSFDHFLKEKVFVRFFFTCLS